MLTGKWTPMNRDVGKFNSLVNETKAMSGENDENLMTRIEILYRAHEKSDFKHKSAWNFLKGKHKWNNPKSTHARRNRNRVTNEEPELFGDDALPRPPGMYWDAKTQCSLNSTANKVKSEFAVFTEACQAAYEASKPKVHRTPVERDHYGAHDRLVMAYFSEHPQYDEVTFRKCFRMSRRLFTKIAREVTDASHFLQERYDCTGQRSISALMKCTSAICQMAYGAGPDSLDENMQMGATTTRDSLRIFCKHGFPGMLGSIDCTNWSWANCLVAFKAQFSRGDHGPDPFILLEAIASNDLWICNAICPDFFPEEQHRDDDPVRTHVESMQVTQEIIDRTAHLSLKADLVEHIWNNAN
ncbi:ALP1-like protein [Tanacetum coccineum]